MSPDSVKRSQPDYQDRLEFTHKLIKKEGSEAEKEAKIINDFYQLQFKKYLERVSQSSHLPIENERRRYLPMNHIKLTQQLTSTQSLMDPFIDLSPFSPIFPTSGYQNLQYYQSTEEMSTDKQIEYPYQSLESLMNSKDIEILKEIRNVQNSTSEAQDSSIYKLSDVEKGIIDSSNDIDPDEKLEVRVCQSIYKNKPKELLQRAVKIFNDIKRWNSETYKRIILENEKSDEQWARESELLKQMSEKNLLTELRMKQYCQFAEFFNFKEEIIQHKGDVIENFNCKHKDKISQSFFRKQELKPAELFDWILLVMITLVIIPEDPEYLELFPLKKSTVFMNTWLLESPMSSKNKNLYKEAKVRNHIRKVMTETYNNLMSQAWKIMDRERLELLIKISESLRLQ